MHLLDVQRTVFRLVPCVLSVDNTSVLPVAAARDLGMPLNADVLMTARHGNSQNMLCSAQTYTQLCGVHCHVKPHRV